MEDLTTKTMISSLLREMFSFTSIAIEGKFLFELEIHPSGSILSFCAHVLYPGTAERNADNICSLTAPSSIPQKVFTWSAHFLYL